MRSIRLSLLVYFLGLLGLALGAVSLLVYRTTQQTLTDKREATAKLIDLQYDERCREEKERLDAALYYQARTLASEVKVQSADRAQLHQFYSWEWWRLSPRQSAFVLGSLAGPPPPSGHVAIPVWLALAASDPPALQPSRSTVARINIDESELLQQVPGQPKRLERQLAEYFQIDSAWGSNYRSASLEKAGLAFPPAPELFESSDGLFWRAETTNLSPGLRVRQVTLKAPVPRLVPPLSPPGSRGRGGDRPSPAIVVQCATSLAAHDAALAGFAEERDAALADLGVKTNDSLVSLRTHLLAITLATFAALVAGSFLLVRLGLSPLHRLSDAVSKVSEKDFRLPFDEPRLPAELAPIVEHLKETLDELRRAFEREKQAAADISHELRTPVAALLTTIDVTLKKPRKPEEYREVLAECRESGQQISQLVERLLTLARLDAGVDRLRVERVDVAALAEQCAALVRPLAEARGVTLRLHGAGEAVLDADPGKLREVLTNLLHNAIEYNRPAGSVDLTVARDNGTLRVEVRDTGVGIAPEARARIFERFYRADPSRHAEGLHAGLGLAIVKGYVDLMGGSIHVESAEGQGSTFRVELPAS